MEKRIVHRFTFWIDSLIEILQIVLFFLAWKNRHTCSKFLYTYEKVVDLLWAISYLALKNICWYNIAIDSIKSIMLCFRDIGKKVYLRKSAISTMELFLAIVVGRVLPSNIVANSLIIDVAGFLEMFLLSKYSLCFHKVNYFTISQMAAYNQHWLSFIQICLSKLLSFLGFRF